jgi:hypothetical protein
MTHDAIAPQLRRLGVSEAFLANWRPGEPHEDPFDDSSSLLTQPPFGDDEPFVRLRSWYPASDSGSETASDLGGLD